MREAALAWQLEQRWSKDRILTAYLNTIYFGNGAYGIQQAARTYFKKDASDLTLPESALLAGIPSDPARYDPVTNPRKAEARRKQVLTLMLEQSKITPRDFARADAARMPQPDDIRLPGTRGKGLYFVNYVKDQLVEKYGAGRVFGGGLRDDDDRPHAPGQGAPGDREGAREPGRAGGGLVAMDPRTGAVKAMFGAGNFRESEFNLAAQAERQPGSAFKPIVLSTARCRNRARVEEGLDRRGRPHLERHELRPHLPRSVTLARAMVSSDNSVYAQLTDLVGPKAIVETAHALGISSPLDAYFSIGLGSLAVNPLEMARAYATLANDGRRVDGSILGDRPRVVERVERIRSRKVEANAPQPTRVLEEGQAEVITGILGDVVRFGTGRRAAIPGVSIAGKTGTTDNYGDAWFVGYTPDLVVAVWVGYPDKLRPMLTEFGGDPVTGGTLPAMIWKRFVESVEDEDGSGSSFSAPPYLGSSSSWVVEREARGSSTTGTARSPARRLLFRARPVGHGGLQAERGLRAARHRHERGRGGRPARRAAARRRDRLRAREAGKMPGLVVNQEPRRGALRERLRPALGLEGPVRTAPQLRRVERRGREPGLGAPSSACRRPRRRPRRDDPPPAPAARNRGEAGPHRPARGRGRLGKLDPART